MCGLTVVLVTIVTAIVLFVKWKLTYWQRRGLEILDPSFFFGDIKDLILNRISFGEKYQRVYNQLKAKGLRHGGIYNMLNPVYIPVDLDIIKHIIQQDHQHFVNHGAYTDETNDPLSGQLFNLEDGKWKRMRVNLTPTFTSGKMKMMFQTFAGCAGGLEDLMNQSVTNKEPVDIKEILCRFTVEIIASCAFGLDCNSLKDPESEFLKCGKLISHIPEIERLKFIAEFVFPHTLLKRMWFKVTKLEVEEFIVNTIRETVEYREKNNLHKKDFLHLLIQLKNRGEVADDGKITNESGEIAEKALTIPQIAAQAFVFFMAGLESSATVMTFALYEMATNIEVQDNLRQEIDTVLKKYNGELTYDGIMEMTYLDNIISETLRKYPPFPIVFRKCTRDYKVPSSSVTIEKGTQVFVPLMGLHMDPEYYPDPEKFDPERFTEENKSKRPAFTWLPFGGGPRLCIGLRFGLMQTKVGLVTVLRNYRIKLSARTRTPIKIPTECFVLRAAGGIWLDMEKLM